MTEITLAQATANPQSPFDSIRRFDEQGNEFWMGRELQKMLGYKSWQKFQALVERTERAITLQEQDSQDHVTRKDNMITVGKGATRTVDDYRLTRFACYLIAMSGDNSKHEIAQAQSYFALKTREAEVAIPVQSDRIRELELKIMEQEHRNLRLKDSMITIHGIELGLILIGRDDRMVEVEKVFTEVVQPETGRCDRILTAAQLIKEVRRKTGQGLKNMKQFTDKLKASGRDDLLKPVTRNNTCEYVDPDRLDEAIAVVYGKERQGLIKPVAKVLV
jgi:hypothetical protein